MTDTSHLESLLPAVVDRASTELRRYGVRSREIAVHVATAVVGEIVGGLSDQGVCTCELWGWCGPCRGGGR